MHARAAGLGADLQHLAQVGHGIPAGGNRLAGMGDLAQAAADPWLELAHGRRGLTLRGPAGEDHLDPVGVPGVEGEVDPVVVERGAERRRKVTAGAHGPQRRQSLR